jgi:hypothetical protein
LIDSFTLGRKPPILEAKPAAYRRLEDLTTMTAKDSSGNYRQVAVELSDNQANWDGKLDEIAVFDRELVETKLIPFFFVLPEEGKSGS